MIPTEQDLERAGAILSRDIGIEIINAVYSSGHITRADMERVIDLRLQEVLHALVRLRCPSSRSAQRQLAVLEA